MLYLQVSNPPLDLILYSPNAIVTACRTRRVKCDETRPECVRCQKSGRKCDGYAVSVKGPPQPLAPRSQPLLIRPHNQPLGGEMNHHFMSLFANQQSVPSFSISRSPSIPLLHDETEAHYFQIYCERTATKIGGYWENGIWSRLIIQVCHQEPFARHAVVSVGALDLAMEYQTLQSRPSADDQGEYADNPHHQFALQQYGSPYNNMARL